MPFRTVRYFIAVIATAAICNFAGETRRQLTPPELMQIVKTSRDPETRQDAVKRLAEISESEERNMQVAETFVDILKTTPDPFLGKQLVRTLTQLQVNMSKRPKTKYIVDFMAILKNPAAVPGIRTEIADNFRQTLDKDELKDKDAFVLLKAIAQSKTEPNVSLRARCIEAIGGFGDPDNIAMLCELLTDKDDLVKEAAANALTTLLDRAPVNGKSISMAAANKIVEMVNDDKLAPTVRIKVIRADAQMMACDPPVPGANRGLETIIKLAKTAADDNLVLTCIEALGIIGSSQAADPLIATYNDFFNKANMMNEKDVPIRRAVVRALRSVLTAQDRKMNAEMPTVHKVAELLVSVLDNDPAVNVKSSAVYAIGYMYPKKFAADQKEATFALVFLLEKRDTDASLKGMIPDTLEAITGVNFGLDAERWKGWLQTKYPGARP